jgi:hypothetical protein
MEESHLTGLKNRGAVRFKSLQAQGGSGKGAQCREDPEALQRALFITSW